MKTTTNSTWLKIRSRFTGEEIGITTIYACLTEDENEEGEAIALVGDFGVVVYLDKRAKTDVKAQEVIKETVERIKANRQQLVDELIEVLKEDFRSGDYTVIDSLLVNNVSLKVLKDSLPEKLV